jgi:hypothetical protein
MTFTYDLGDPDAITHMRFALGDVVADGAIFSDEELVYVAGQAGSWQAGVIACLQSIVARIAAEPKFTADWLSVDAISGLEAYQALLRMKRREYGLGEITGVSAWTYRADSLATDVPDYGS